LRVEGWGFGGYLGDLDPEEERGQRLEHGLARQRLPPRAFQGVGAGGVDVGARETPHATLVDEPERDHQHPRGEPHLRERVCVFECA